MIRVKFSQITPVGGIHLTIEVAAVPRVGDYVLLGGISYTVRNVTWMPEDAECAAYVQFL